MFIKIKKLKNLSEVKVIHNFLIENYKNNLRENPNDPFPVKETYDEMVDLLSTNKTFLLKAEISGVLAGCAVAVLPNEDDKSVWLRAIIVKKYFQKKGVAKKLLKTLEANIKKAGYSTIKIVEKEGANGFFIRAGFIPYLYVSTTDEKDVPKIREANVRNFKILNETHEEGKHFFKFDVEEEAVYADKHSFYVLSKNMKSYFVYEKKLTKK